jgi:hypothetical protein
MQESFAATRQVPRYVPEAQPPAPSPNRDPIADLKDLAELRASGVLTDDEFTAAKVKILGTGA